MYNANEKIFYQIYPLGFCGAPQKNDMNSAPCERLNKINDWIGHMKNLGINALYLGPLFESYTHGYDTINYYEVDRRLGCNQTLKYLIKNLHNAGIEVILDGVFNHVGREFFAFKDLMYFNRNSRYKDWFDGVDFGRRSPYNDEFTYNTWAGHYSLVKLNHKNCEVSDHILNAVKFWISEFDIDGIRLDAADSLDFNFMNRLSAVTRGMKPDFWLMGEVVHGNYARWVNEAGIDSTTNYECYKGLYSSHNDKNYFEIAYSLKRQFSGSGIYKNIPLYNFADNHDVERVASIIKNKCHLYPLYILLFMMPGIPSVYYGSEWEIQGRKISGSDNSLRPALDINKMNNTMSTALLKHISNLARIRKELNAVKYGNYEELFVDAQKFGFLREVENEKVAVIVNSSADTIYLDKLNMPYGMYIDFLNKNEIVAYDNSIPVKVHPNWGVILKKL